QASVVQASPSSQSDAEMQPPPPPSRPTPSPLVMETSAEAHPIRPIVAMSQVPGLLIRVLHGACPPLAKGNPPFLSDSAHLDRTRQEIYRFRHPDVEFAPCAAPATIPTWQ